MLSMVGVGVGVWRYERLRRTCEKQVVEERL